MVVIRYFRIPNNVVNNDAQSASLIPNSDILPLDKLEATVIYQDVTHSLVSVLLSMDQVADISDLAESDDPLSMAAVEDLGIDGQYMGMDLDEVLGRWESVSGVALDLDKVIGVVWA